MTFRKRAYERKMWTDEEHAEMWRMHLSGMTRTDIGRALGRAMSSITGRLACTDETGRFRTLDERTIKIWTPAESDRIAAMRAAGMSTKDIAAAIGSATDRQVQSRLRQINGSRAPRSAGPKTGPMSEKMRLCLSCLGRGKKTMFLSQHAGIRMCKACIERSRETDSPYNPGTVGAL